MKINILVQSSNIPTYKNIVAAIAQKYTSIESICFSFVGCDIDYGFVSKLIEELKLDCNPIYLKASKLVFLTTKINQNSFAIEQEWDVIDVTAVSKEIALIVFSCCIGNKTVEICSLRWKNRVEKGASWILTSDNHEYSNLLTQNELRKLYGDYFKKKQVIFVFGVIFLVLICLSIIKYLYSDFQIPADIVNVLSLLIGVGGLYLSILSLKSN